LYPFILALLDRFEITFDPRSPLGEDLEMNVLASFKEENQKYIDRNKDSTDCIVRLIPTLFPHSLSNNISEFWPPLQTNNSDIKQWGRQWILSWVPFCFFGSLVTRLMNFDYNKVFLWNGEFLIFLPCVQLRVQLLPKDLKLNVYIRTSLEGVHQGNISMEIFSIIETVISDCYNLESSILIPCTHCMANELTPFMYPLVHCISLLSKLGKPFLTCPKVICIASQKIQRRKQTQEST